MTKFRKNQADVLVATDVASRGLDITGVSHIFNYDIPSRADDYTHRIGRTARAGKTGRAISILSQDDHDNMRRVHVKYKDVESEFFEGFKSNMYPKIKFGLQKRRKANSKKRFYRKKIKNRGKMPIIKSS